MAPADVTLYRAPHTACDVDAIADWLAPRIDAGVHVDNPFLKTFRDEDLAAAFADARIHGPFDRETGSSMHGILAYERRTLAHPERSGGVLYDGLAIQRALNRSLPEGSLDHLHVPVLGRHLATWGEYDGRWHKRIAVLGQPAILSVPGVAEAPAKPEAYYELKQRHALVHGDAPPREVLEAAIEEDVIVPEDPRITEILKGYVLAAINLVATGEGFCGVERCRLSNPHRHEGVIRAQLTEPEFCERHARRYAASARP